MLYQKTDFVQAKVVKKRGEVIPSGVYIQCRECRSIADISKLTDGWQIVVDQTKTQSVSYAKLCPKCKVKTKRTGKNNK